VELSSQPKTRRLVHFVNVQSLVNSRLFFFLQQTLKMIIKFREIDIFRLERQGKNEGSKATEDEKDLKIVRACVLFAFMFILVTDISPIAQLMSVTSFK